MHRDPVRGRGKAQRYRDAAAVEVGTRVKKLSALAHLIPENDRAEYARAMDDAAKSLDIRNGFPAGPVPALVPHRRLRPRVDARGPPTPDTYERRRREKRTLDGPDSGPANSEGRAMKVELLYFDGCPNWELADERLAQAARLVSRGDLTVQRRRVDTEQEAVALGFTGSPTIVIDGQDPFATGSEQVGLACRIYATPYGLSGSPSVDQFVGVLT